VSLNDFLNSPESQLHELIFLMDSHANDLLNKDFGLNFNHFKILMILYQNPDFNQKQVSKCMFFTESGISKTITTLKKLKYLESVENPTNRREHQLKLTKLGQQIVENAFKSFRKESERLFSVLTDKEEQNFYNSIQKLISNFH